MALPLDHITVLDLGQVYGGPYCGLLLMHLGARVIKVETPGTGEPLRSRGEAPSESEPINFQLLNGGKEAIALDLKEPGDRDVFYRLAGSADVVIENFAPGTASRLGIDFDDLKAINPRLVYASLKAYAPDSPNASLRGMDLTIQASTAVMSATGFPDGPPVRSGPSLVDFLGGTHLVVGILAALVEREKTGLGQAVEVALQDAVIPSLASGIAGWLTNPATALDRTGNRHGGMLESPYNAYETSDGWITVLCITAPQWHGLCELMGRQDLRDDRSLDTSLGRVARMYEIDDAVGAWTIERTSAEATAALQEAGVPASAIKTIAQLYEDELLRTEPMIQRSVDENGTPTYTFGSPVRFRDHPARSAGPVPKLGRDTDAVLASIGLGAGASAPQGNDTVGGSDAR
jgi:formyl-CoA transferase